MSIPTRRTLSDRKPFAGITLRRVYGRPWREFFRDLYHEINEDNLFNGSAALGFYLTLAIFPALIFVLGLLPYLPLEGLRETIDLYLQQFLPGDTAKMIHDTLAAILEQRHDNLLSIGAVLTLWAASSGLYSLMQAMNITYDVKEGRPWWRTRATALGLMLAFGVLTVLALSLTVAGDQLEKWLATQTFWNAGLSLAFNVARWLVVVAALSAAFALVYYFGPDVDQKFVFITPGSVLGVVCLLVASLGFKLYVEKFGNYNATYGSIGAVIVLMLWLNILGFVALLGSEVNALLEHYSPEGKAKGEKDEEARAA